MVSDQGKPRNEVPRAVRRPFLVGTYGAPPELTALTTDHDKVYVCRSPGYERKRDRQHTTWELYLHSPGVWYDAREIRANARRTARQQYLARHFCAPRRTRSTARPLAARSSARAGRTSSDESGDPEPPSELPVGDGEPDSDSPYRSPYPAYRWDEDRQQWVPDDGLEWHELARKLASLHLDPERYRSHVLWVSAGQGCVILPPSREWWDTWAVQECQREHWRHNRRALNASVSEESR